MSNRKLSTKKIFNKLYRSLVQDINATFRNSKLEIPKLEQQQEIIESAKKNKCKRRFIVLVKNHCIMPLFMGDELYPFDISMMPLKKYFLTHIHPKFLVPYMLNARFAYSFAAEIKKMPIEKLKEFQYKISIPMKFKNDDNWAWHCQKSELLSTDEDFNILSHINMYEFESPMLDTEENSERRYIKATFINNQDLDNYFKQLLDERLREYFISENILKQKHITILLKSKSEVAKQGEENKKEKYADADIRSEILDILEIYNGYRFLNIREAKRFLERLGII